MNQETLPSEKQATNVDATSLEQEPTLREQMSALEEQLKGFISTPEAEALLELATKIRREAATVLGQGLVHERALKVNPLRDQSERVGRMQIEMVLEMSGNGLAKGFELPPAMLKILMEAAGDSKNHAYDRAGGLLIAKEAIARLARRQDCPTSIDNVFITSGAVDAYDLLLSVLNPLLHQRVALPNICHPSISGLTEKHELADPITYSIDPLSGKPDLETLEKILEENQGNIAALYINHPANPSGLVYDEDTLRGIVHLAKKYGVFIISDEIYGELVLDTTVPFISMAKIAGEEKVPSIILNGLSKMALMGGDRIGWMIFYGFDKNSELKDYQTAIFRLLQDKICPPVPPQFVIPHLLTEEFREWLKRDVVTPLQEHYEDIQSLLAPAIEAGLIQLSPLGGGMYSNMVLNLERLNLETLALPEDLPDSVRGVIEESLDGARHPDERLVWHLVARGAGFLPLSGFATPDKTGKLPIPQGLRGTLLECDNSKREKAYESLVKALLDCAV